MSSIERGALLVCTQTDVVNTIIVVLVKEKQDQCSISIEQKELNEEKVSLRKALSITSSSRFMLPP